MCVCVCQVSLRMISRTAPPVLCALLQLHLLLFFATNGSEYRFVCRLRGVKLAHAFVCARIFDCVCAFECRLDGARRVRRCCRALLTAAGNQSTLSMYSPTRRFLNDLP